MRGQANLEASFKDPAFCGAGSSSVCGMGPVCHAFGHGAKERSKISGALAPRGARGYGAKAPRVIITALLAVGYSQTARDRKAHLSFATGISRSDMNYAGCHELRLRKRAKAESKSEVQTAK